jgi:hypothetical protein
VAGGVAAGAAFVAPVLSFVRVDVAFGAFLGNRGASCRDGLPLLVPNSGAR